jgi:toxin ParE1/3/4
LQSGEQMQVRWLATALQNLDQEANYIAKDDPQAAKLVMQRIHQAVKLLADNPALGHPGRVHGTRELVVPDTRYIIPYRVRPRLNRIEILRVFHSSRKSPGNWI